MRTVWTSTVRKDLAKASQDETTEAFMLQVPVQSSDGNVADLARSRRAWKFGPKKAKRCVVWFEPSKRQQLL